MSDVSQMMPKWERRLLTDYCWYIGNTCILLLGAMLQSDMILGMALPWLIAHLLAQPDVNTPEDAELKLRYAHARRNRAAGSGAS